MNEFEKDPQEKTSDIPLPLVGLFIHSYFSCSFSS